MDPAERLDLLLEQWNAELPTGFSTGDVDRARALAEAGSGVPVRFAARYPDDVFGRARLVRNTVEVNEEAPTLAEVREMIDEAVREADEEEAEVAGGASASSDSASSQL